MMLASLMWLWRLTDLILFPEVVVHDLSVYHSLSRVLSRRCPSPEKDTPWPYEYESCPTRTPSDDPEARHVIGHSRTSTLTCGLCKQNDFTKYLDRLSKITRPYIQQHCPVVIYSVKFGKMNKPLSKRFNLTASQNSTGVNNCLILFMLGEDSEFRLEHGEFVPVLPGAEEYLLSSQSEPWALRVPLPKRVLPYKNNRRNVKLIKMHGFQIFDWADQIIWMDGKFRQELSYDTFATYYRETIADRGVCASFVGLPSDLATMGPDHSRFAAPTFRGHCQTILAATRGRPTVTDSTGAIALQCEDYLRKVSQYSEHKPDGALGSETLLWSTSLSSLDYGMIDSALIAWNMREKRCRQFMADLACTWADQIQCYADRDQVSFPYALSTMGLRVDSGDGIFDPILWKDARNQSVVQIVQSTCHWYASPTFDCVHNATISKNATLNQQRWNREIPSQSLVILKGEGQRFVISLDDLRVPCKQQ